MSGHTEKRWEQLVQVITLVKLLWIFVFANVRVDLNE